MPAEAWLIISQLFSAFSVRLKCYWLQNDPNLRSSSRIKCPSKNPLIQICEVKPKNMYEKGKYSYCYHMCQRNYPVSVKLFCTSSCNNGSKEWLQEEINLLTEHRVLTAFKKSVYSANLHCNTPSAIVRTVVPVVSIWLQSELYLLHYKTSKSGTSEKRHGNAFPLTLCLTV